MDAGATKSKGPDLFYRLFKSINRSNFQEACKAIS